MVAKLLAPTKVLWHHLLLFQGWTSKQSIPSNGFFVLFCFVLLCFPSNGFFFLLLDHMHVMFSSYVWIIYSNKDTEINWFSFNL